MTSEIRASCKYLKKDHHLNKVQPFGINPKGVGPLSTALVTFTTQARRPQYKLTDGLQGFRPKKVVGVALNQFYPQASQINEHFIAFSSLEEIHLHYGR